jgi:hypothetical protein
LIPNLAVVGTAAEVIVVFGVALSVQRWVQDILFASYLSRSAVAPTQPPIQWVPACSFDNPPSSRTEDNESNKRTPQSVLSWRVTVRPYL